MIVVGFITTKEGRSALAASVEEARLRNLKLVVLTPEHPKAGSETELAELKSKLANSSDGLQAEFRSVIGDLDPGEDLVRIATEEDADLIVIGLRRRTPVGKLILGSNAQRVLLDAPCPVLAVKA